MAATGTGLLAVPSHRATWCGTVIGAAGADAVGPKAPGLSCAVVAGNFDPVAYNRAAWDREVENDNEWTRPAGAEVIARARAGDWSVVLIGYHPTPRDWFPAELAGAAVLCLVSGGGQQGPVLAAAGTTVTVFDNSPRQLSQGPRRSDGDAQATVGYRRGRGVSAVSPGAHADGSRFTQEVVSGSSPTSHLPRLARIWINSGRS